MTTRGSRQGWLRRTACAALLIATAVTATGCTQGANADIVFDFTQGGEVGKSMSFEIPTALQEIALSDRTVASIPVRAESRPIESDALCAVDFTLEHSAGFVDLASSEDQVVENQHVQGNPLSLLSLTFDDFTPKYWSSLEESSVWPIERFDPEEPVAGTYHSKDFTKLLVVGPCALTTHEEAGFPVGTYVKDESGQISTLAMTKVWTMKNGDVFVVATEVFGYALDTNGDWIKR